jgi:2-polyprenyl-3-methyl-5-hydroxy-6-metoxy-1,4-benzoquinol methylase
MSRARIEQTVKACYSTWSESYYEEYYGADAKYPPAHVRLLRGLLLESGARTVLDAGCGPASFLRELDRDELELYGFDLTPEMVLEARHVFERIGILVDRVWEGSVLEPAAFRQPGGRERFDAAVCVGVLPHVAPEADEIVLDNLRNAVEPGGLVAVEARNELFALFTLNRYAHRFLVDGLIRADELRAKAGDERERLDQALAGIERFFRLDLPPVRRGKAGEPGYDEVLSRTHNPLVLARQMEAAGFEDVRTLYYHFHALPPMLEDAVPELFRRESLALEDAPEDVRGTFMASAFILAGRRA